MNYIYIGKITNTHGLKGELKIKSNFKFKDQVFVVNNNIYVGDSFEEFTIVSYRPHKEYDMVIFKGINNIEQVEIYKGLKVYFNKDSIILNKDEYLNEDLIALDVYFNNNYLGKVKKIEDYGEGNEILEIIGNKRILVPKNNYFFEKIDIKNKKMTLKNTEGMI